MKAFLKELGLMTLEAPFIVFCSYGAALLVWTLLFPLSLLFSRALPTVTGVVLGLVAGGYMVYMLQSSKKRKPFWWLE